MAKKIKIILITLLTLVLASAFAACDFQKIDSGLVDDNSSSGTQTDDSSSKVTIDADLIETIPDSGYTVKSIAGTQTATAHWFVTYGEDALEFTAYVEDAKIYQNDDVYSSDGVAVYLAKAQRKKGYSDGAIMIAVSVKGNVVAKNLSTAEALDGITATVRQFTFDSETVAGYKVTFGVPYELTEVSATAKDAALAFSLTNANNAMTITTSSTNTFGADLENVHTWASLTDTDVFAASKYVKYGAFWGDGGTLTAATTWDLENDVVGEGASVKMTGVDNKDNYLYAYETGAYTNYYFEAKINAGKVLNSEYWGKIGLAVFDAEGQDGFFYYIDACAGDGKTINSNSIALGSNSRSNGGWSGNWTTIGSLGGTSAQYTGDNYVTLGIYRQGGAFKVYANGNLVGTVSCGIVGNETAYVSLCSFNILMTVKDYSIKTEGLDDYYIAKENVEYLFLGDSYIDTAFWYTWESEFGSLSAANIGVGGTKIGYWQAMTQTLKEMYATDNIIVHIGVNDIDDGGSSANDTIVMLKDLFDGFRAIYPDVNVYYVGLVNNMMFKDQGKWSIYEAVNVAIEEYAASTEWLTFIDMASVVKANDEGSTMSWFNGDGLHYGVDGYGVLNREVSKALGLSRVENEGGLGDLSVEGAPDWSYSGGWKFSGDGVAHNTGKDESQIFIQGAYGADVYAEAKISVAGVNKYDAYPKAGLAVRTTKATYFWGLDCFLAGNGNGTYFTNQWSNVWIRYDVLNRDWDWHGYFGDNLYQHTYTTSFDYNNDHSFKTMAIAKVGSSLYLIADGKVVNCLKGVMDADEEVAISVFNFNMDMYAKDGVAITETAALTEKLTSLKIYKDETMKIDGKLDDWTDAMKSNPHVIPATDGRSITIYSTMGADGMYIFYDAIVNSTKTDGEWYEATNIELRIANGEQRFASLKSISTTLGNGFNSRYEGDYQRQINAAKFIVTKEGDQKHVTCEAFISYACIDGYDVTSEYIPAGFAWKTAGETGALWADGDWWYVPEVDPAFRFIAVTKNGLLGAKDMTIDGSAADWAGVTMLNATTQSGVTAQYAWKRGTDGLYAIYTITGGAIDINRTNTSGDWWQNTNLEFWETDTHYWGRIMLYDGKIYHTGLVTDAAFTFVENEGSTTLTIEFFMAYNVLKPAASTSETITVNFGGQLHGIFAGAGWQDYSRNVTIAV